MSPSRWKSPVLACAIFLAALCATDTPPDAINAHPHIVIAINAPKPAPVVVHTISAPVIAVPDTLPVFVAQIPPLAVSPVLNTAKSAPAAAPRTVAANPAPVTANPRAEPKTLPDIVAQSVTPSVADGEKPQLTFDRRILMAHNRERRDLGLEPLSWNPALAQSAQRWAEHLAQTGRFEHAPENHVAPEGENLWAGTRGYYTPEAMVAAWIREKRYFRLGVFPDNSTTGNVEDIGHYTQVVWRATHEVGCAEAASASEDILVCRYAEAGNYRGERPF